MPPSAGLGWLPAFARPSRAGVQVDEVSALNLAAIWRGVTVLADDIAKLPLGLYERLPDGGKRLDPTLAVAELLAFPNATQTGRKLRSVWTAHRTLWGNSYSEVLRDEDGLPVRIEILDPRWVEPRRDGDGRLTYWLKGRKSPWSGRSTLLPENVLHFTGLSLNGDVGLSPIRANVESIGTALAVDRYAGTLWGNGAVPQGVIKCPPGWDEDARVNFRQGIKEINGGVDNANELLILEEGAEFVATAFNPEQLQMVSVREFTVVEVARIVGLPPHKLGDYSHDVQRALEEMNREYVESYLVPICQGMADEIALKLLLTPQRRAYFPYFDVDWLMRGNALQRAQANAILMQNGVITANEWRAESGRNPFAEDVRLMPLNMAKLAGGKVDEPGPTEGEPADPAMPDLGPLPRSLPAPGLVPVVIDRRDHDPLP